jgi:hypothetical protein
MKSLVNRFLFPTHKLLQTPTSISFSGGLSDL